MRTFISYLIELNIAITLLLLIYFVLFKKDSNFNNRRAFLLFAMGISYLIPLIKIDFSQASGTLYFPVIHLEELIFKSDKTSVLHNYINIPNLLLITYLTVSSLLLIRLILSIFRILQNFRYSEKREYFGKYFYINSNLHASSFFNIIFIDPQAVNDKELKLIIDHESYHARLLHSIDRMMSELLLIFCWFNPAVWILRKAIVVNHEYQADNKVIEKGADQVSYQLTILNQYIGSASISNQFSNQIKNRIKMLNKNYKKGSFWKSIVLLPIATLLLFFMSCNNETAADDESRNEFLTQKAAKSAEEQIFYVVEEMPQWPGDGDFITEIRNFIAEKLIYPEEAKLAGAEGRVFIHFLVTKTGDVVIPDPSMLPPEKNEAGNENEVVVVAYRPINEGAPLPDKKIVKLFQEESIRVINLLPDMIPGKQRGEEVNVIFTMPITFKLQ